MRKFNYSYDSNIIMDRCRICSGVWTDEGEAYQAAIYNKGNPKLDKLGSSVATHVQEREDLKEFVEGVDNLARGGGALYLGIQGVLPVGDDMPKRSFPFVIVGLILLNAGSLIVGLLSDDFKGFCCGMGAIPAHILAGQDILTLFSGMFCHASIAHLAGNMFFLWLFGSHVEDAFHHACFILFYLFCGLVSALVYLAANPHSTIPCVGASGAIAGVMAAYLVLYPSSHLRLLVGGMVMTLPAWVYLVGWFVVQSLHSMLSSGTGGGVAWFAHIGGFLCGIAVTTPMRKFLVAGNSA